MASQSRRPHAPTSPKKKSKSRRRAESGDAIANPVQKRPKNATPDGEPATQSLDVSQPRRSARAGAGSGGRLVSLEKIGAVLEGSKKPRRATDVPEGTAENLLAPGKLNGGRSTKKFDLPPPYPAEAAIAAPDAPSPVLHYSPPDSTSERFGFVPPSTGSSVGAQFRNPYDVAAGTQVTSSRPSPSLSRQVSRQPSMLDVRQQQASQTLYGNHNAVHSASGISNLQIDPVLLAKSSVHPNADLQSRVHNHAARSDALLTANRDKDCSDSTQTSSSSDEESLSSNEGNVDGDDGWCATNQKKTAHPGFSEEFQPNTPPRHVSLPPEQEFDYSRDKDDEAAQRLLGQPDKERYPRQTAVRPHGEVVDVLHAHHQVNGRPLPPQSDWLVNASSVANQAQLNEVNEAHANVEPRSRAPRNSKKNKDDPAAPDTLVFYPPMWKDLLEDAKRSCRIAHLIKNPFPSKSRDLKTSITESLVATVVEWTNSGSTLEPGYWPEHKNNMASLLLADIATWRSELKSVVLGIAPSAYGLVPPQDTRNQLEWVKSEVAGLLNDSMFLRDGLDHNGKTNNFAHRALRQAITEFFYVGTYRIANKRPDLFRDSVPVPCLALVATAYNCVLDGFAQNGSGKKAPQFSGKLYASIHSHLLSMVDEVSRNDYHGRKLRDQLEGWGRDAWAMLQQSDTFVERHDHLSVVLD